MRRLAQRLAEARKDGTLPWLRPDGKTQVTIEYEKDGGAVVPVHLHTLLISAQHDPGISPSDLRDQIMEHVVAPVVPAHLVHGGGRHGDTRFLVNPSGSFVVGGPAADAGLTGRKSEFFLWRAWLGTAAPACRIFARAQQQQTHHNAHLHTRPLPGSTPTRRNCRRFATAALFAAARR